ncbi:anaphase-promoting complex subunit 11 [Colletotrichum incanum]|nr:anaphase-promoting complex subunit 11 [Colletotrichum incanum]
MKVKITRWNTVATWRWDIPEDDVCGICQVHFDGTCPTCKYPGDDCSLLSGKCGHNFHMNLNSKHCILEWIKQDSAKGQCPMCRQTSILSYSEKDATERDARDPVNIITSSRRPRPNPPPFPACRHLLFEKHATSTEFYCLMMADVPTSPRPEAEQPVPASLSSSSQNQKAVLGGPSDNQLGTDAASATPPVPDAEAAAENEPDAEPVAPKLDPAGFFTLVSNSTTNTTHHPTVKYIFLDDDPDTLTTALAVYHSANQTSTPSASTSKSGSGKNLTPNPANRAVLLDVVPGVDGQWKVSSAASLSADFAVTDASITRQEGEKEGGLVLKIEGVENESGASAVGDKDKDRAESLPSSNSAVAKSGGEEYGPLLEDFERKMSVLRRVVKAGEGRAEKAREKKPASDVVEPKKESEE